ncbi:related to double-strand-break repair protein rad21 [Phialocephala subalpina]|uniref:Related to double-strand-break repair protein rad21 n=1 Tax=Phialocephala subalpina TaxID=576137 RepID=A0A1L7WC56_9HELO|nr:related to double-strand-break repair protein rad21 [Phialocephala subalpina]
MFYSETLLSKTGPLARVWLSANLERKLSKNHILQASVKDSVDAIVTPNQAPMALRLSGQLLLGVVRIYSRKARYLLDDCNEALMKIKMAFRLSGNNDIPAGLHMPSRDALMLPDVLTEGDNLEMPPMPDASFLFSQLEDDTPQRKRRAGSRDINLQEDFTGSQFLQNSIENQNDDDLVLEPMDDLDLGLDFGLDIDDFNPKADRTMEIGRDAPAARAAEDDLLSELDIQVPSKDNEAGERDTSLNLDFGGGDDGIRLADDDGDYDMLDMGGDDIVLPPAPLVRPERISESPLSDIDDDLAAEVEAEHQRNLNSTLFEPEDETEQSVFRNPAQRARRQRFLHADSEIMLATSQIKEQQESHDKILRPQSFLPRDPALLTLMEMQKNGGFVSNIMGDGRSSGWAPELRGMLSLNAVRRSGELKRKRDSGIADMESGDEQNPSKSPRLDLGEEDDLAAGLDNAGGIDANTTVAPDGTMIELADDDGFMMNNDDEHEPSAGLDALSPGPNFDETTAPLVHPADSGPVSLGTKHAVHLLRDQFGPDAANSPDKRKKASVLFQDLLPEASTTRADATKMFFEILVLATKDAVKVDQNENLVGAPIRVRGKRGLWGDWAEREAGGEIAEEEAGPSSTLERPTMVAVAA